MGNDELSKTDRTQNAKLKALRKDIADLQADLIRPELVEGKNQRLVLRAPSKNTTVTLGHVKDGQSYSGFSAQTDGHVFLQAKSGEALVQSDGRFRAQSHANSLLLAKGAAVVSGEGTTHIMGGQGVSIDAGPCVHVDSKDPNDSDVMPDATLKKAAGYTFSAISFAAATALTAWSSTKQGIEPSPSFTASLDSVASGMSATYGALSTAVTTGLAAAGSNASAGESVNIYASKAFGVNAIRDIGLTSGLTAGIMSNFVGLTGFVNAGMLGLNNAELASMKKATVAAGKEVDVASGTQTVVSTGPKGGAASLTLRAEALDATLKAKGGVDLDAGDGKSLVQMTNAGGYSVTSEKSAKILVADEYEIEVTKDGIKIGKKGGKPVVEINDKGVDIKGKKKTTMHAGDSHVAVKPDKASVHGKSQVTIQGSKVTANGKKINLG